MPLLSLIAGYFNHYLNRYPYTTSVIGDDKNVLLLVWKLRKLDNEDEALRIPIRNVLDGLLAQYKHLK